MTTQGAPAPGADLARIALADSIRASAICVQGVLAGRSLSDCLANTHAALRPSTQAISFHVMRRLGLAQAARSRLVKRLPPDPLLDALLLVSLTLLETAIAAEQRAQEAADNGRLAGKDDLDTGSRRDLPVYAVHTVVDQAVSTARGKLRPYRGLLNGVLRNYIRQRDALLPQLFKKPEARWNYPSWWIAEIRKAWPQQWESILEAGNAPGPMMLRVNQRRATVDSVVAGFAEAGIEARAVSGQAVVLAQPRPVQALPGFQQGLWSVQDASAQLAGTLLPLRPGARVLDACSAPGGKTAHLLERADIDLLALDSDPVRLQRVAENLERLGLDGPQVRLVCADAADPASWWDGQPFDSILADVPCTASGVVRRHPDIRWLRRPGDLENTSALQRSIMDALWRTLAPGGHLLFATCSIFPHEGEAQAVAFCQRHGDARRLPAPGQILPQHGDGSDNAGDGFFYALFSKAVQSDDNH